MNTITESLVSCQQTGGEGIVKSPWIMKIEDIYFYQLSQFLISGFWSSAVSSNDSTPTRNCNPANNDQTCCTSSAQCGLGEGDCDHDSECAGDLVCGENNCAAGQSIMDCCASKQLNVLCGFCFGNFRCGCFVQKLHCLKQ